MDGVVFLNVGRKHLVHAAVAIYTLRQYYDGPVCMLSGCDEFEKHFEGEKRLGDFQVKRFDYQPKFGCYHAKTQMGELSPFERSIFFDLDTIVVGEFRELWPEVDEQVILTRFSTWDTLYKRIAQRIGSNGWPELAPRAYAYQSSRPYPAINTGVLGFSKSSTRFMDAWHKLTTAQVELSKKRDDVSAFITDEIAAQMLAFEYPCVIAGEKYNASPRYKPKGWKGEADVRVWHGHGAKFFKADEETQNAIWLPRFFAALKAGFANLDRWHDRRRGYGRKRPCRYVDQLEYKYEQWLKTGEIPKTTKAAK